MGNLAVKEFSYYIAGRKYTVSNGQTTPGSSLKSTNSKSSKSTFDNSKYKTNEYTSTGYNPMYSYTNRYGNLGSGKKNK